MDSEPAPDRNGDRKAEGPSSVDERVGVAPPEAPWPEAESAFDLRPAEGVGADRELARMASALAHPVRVQILRLMARHGAVHCGELVERLPLAQSTISQHLKVLKVAGLIRGDVLGPRSSYDVDPRGLRRLRVLVAGI